MSRPVALICSAISAAERAPCWPRTSAIAEPMVRRASAWLLASGLRFGLGLVLREGSFSSAWISRSAMRRSTIFASSSAIFARMRSSDVSMAVLLILNMTTCYFGILARSNSRGVRSIVATRLSIRLTTSTRLKSVVNRDSISDRNTVGVVRETYHGKQFCKLFIGHRMGETPIWEIQKAALKDSQADDRQGIDCHEKGQRPL